jgi:hypothetical protein
MSNRLYITNYNLISIILVYLSHILFLSSPYEFNVPMPPDMPEPLVYLGIDENALKLLPIPVPVPYL